MIESLNEIRAWIEVCIAIGGGIYIIGQMRANSQRNQEAITGVRELITKNMEETKALIDANLKGMKELLSIHKEYQKEDMERELNHLKDLINMSSAETREDIKRLERKQEETNKVKERLFKAEASLKSIHHRLDIEPPIECQ